MRSESSFTNCWPGVCPMKRRTRRSSPPLWRAARRYHPISPILMSRRFSRASCSKLFRRSRPTGTDPWRNSYESLTPRSNPYGRRSAPGRSIAANRNILRRARTRASLVPHPVRPKENLWRASGRKRLTPKTPREKEASSAGSRHARGRAEARGDRRRAPRVPTRRTRITAAVRRAGAGRRILKSAPSWFPGR